MSCCWSSLLCCGNEKERQPSISQHQPQQQQQHTVQDSEQDTAEPGAKVTAARRATARLSRWEAGSSDVSARVWTCGDW